MRHLPKIAIVTVAGILAGCGGDSGSEEAADSNPQQQQQQNQQEQNQNTPSESAGPQTPQAAFEAMMTAVKADDWNAAVKTLTPESQGMMAGALTSMLPGLAQFDEKVDAQEVDALMKKHKVDPSNMAEMQGDPSKALRKVAEAIPDKTGFITRCLELASKSEMSKRQNIWPIPDDAKLENLQVEEGSATAVAVKLPDRTPIEFRNVNGGWLVVFTPETLGMAGGRPGPKPNVPDVDDAAPNTDKPAPDTSFNIPDEPAGGSIHGIAFKPTEVELDGGSLTFSQGEDFLPDLQVRISLQLDGETVDGRTFEVTDPEQFIKPHVSLRWKPEGEKFAKSGFVDKYVMRVVFGEREKRSIDGKLEFRSLDEGDDTRIAGTFTAKIAADLSKPPTELDRPYVFGRIALSGAEEYKLTSGIIGLSKEGKRIGNLAGTTFQADGGGSVASTTFKPQITAVTGTPEGLLYRHTVLQPGRYLVYVLHDEKLADWRWVTVEDADAEVTQDLRVDTSKRGTLVVTSQADDGTPVALTPLDENGQLPEVAAELRVPFRLKLSGKVEDGKATFADIAPGQYQVQVGEKTAKAEVRAGETTEVSVE